MPDSTLAADMASALLTKAAGTLDSPPTRQLVTWNAQTIAADCEQLVVSVVDFERSLLVAGFGSQIPREPRQQPSIPLAAFEVRLFLDCWPVSSGTGQPPSAASITAAATAALTANWTLWSGINTEVNDGTLFEAVAALGDSCPQVQVGQWTTTGPPAGQIVTGKFAVTVNMLAVPA